MIKKNRDSLIKLTQAWSDKMNTEIMPENTQSNVTNTVTEKITRPRS